MASLAVSNTATHFEAPPDNQPADPGTGHARSGDVYWAAEDDETLAGKVYEKVQRYFQALPSLTIYRTWVKAYNVAYPLIDQDMSRGGSQGQNLQIRVNVIAAYLRLVTALLLGVVPDPIARPVNTDYKSLAQASLVERFFQYFIDASGIKKGFVAGQNLAGMYGMGFQLIHFNKRKGPWKQKKFTPDPTQPTQAPPPPNPLDPYDGIETELFEPKNDDGTPDTNKSTKIVPLRTGAIESRTFGPFDMVFDLGRHDLDHDWLIYPTRYDRFDLAAQFPEAAEEILTYTEPMMFPNETTRTMSQLEIERNQPYIRNPDIITSWTLVHKATYALPAGAKFECLGANIVLEPRHPLPTKRLPIIQWHHGHIDRTALTQSTFHHVLSMGDVINELMSAITTNNISFAKQMLDIPRDADYQIVEITDGLAVIEREGGADAAPHPIQLTASSPEAYKFGGEVLPDFAAQLMGIKKSMLGSPPASWPAQMNRDVWQQALQYQSEAHSNLLEGVREAFNLLLEILKVVDIEILAQVAGISQQGALKMFTAKDFAPIGCMDIKLRDPADADYESRQTLAQNMGQLGLLDKDQYLEVKETGRTEAGTEDQLAIERLIIAENEGLRAGQSPQVQDGQPHMLHMKRHAADQATYDLSTPEGQAAMLASSKHNAEHVMARRNVLAQSPELAEAIGEPPPPPGPGPALPGAPGLTGPSHPTGPGGKTGAPPAGAPPPTGQPGMPPGSPPSTPHAATKAAASGGPGAKVTAAPTGKTT